MDTSKDSREAHDAEDAGPNWFRLPGWLQDVIAGALIALAACAPNPEGPRLAVVAIPATAVSVLIVAFALPWGRRFPLPILGFTVVVAALAPLWTTSTFGFLIAAAIAMLRVASLTTRRTTLVSGGAGMIILTIAAALSGPLGSQYARLLQPAVLLALAAAIGDASRHRRAYISAITERAERAERTRELEADRRVAEERLRIARELHDAAAHQIAAINLHAGVASNALPNRPADAERSLEVIREAARGVLGEISALLRILRSTPDEVADSPGDPAADLTQLDTLVEQFARNGLTVTTSVVGDASQLPGALGIVAYKVLQEGMANALKHGSGARAQVDVTIESGQLTLSVTNELGPAGLATIESGQHGLIGVRERVQLFHGQVTAKASGNEFILLAKVPYFTSVSSSRSIR
jgi:signal transduction histidine kinase